MKNKGFTLIELLIVIAIIGIVVAIAIPNLLAALQKAKQKATMGDMKSLGVCIESYMSDYQMAPGAGGIGFIRGLSPYLVPYHNNNSLPVNDAWGGAFRYQSGAVGANQDLYSVISYGRGAASSGIDTNNNNYEVKIITDFEKDICFANGAFTYGPRVR